jgi:parvulin-like peptidyl-prolyl isomerase
LIAFDRNSAFKQAFIALILVIAPSGVFAQEQKPRDPAAVCARVDDVTIRYADIERERKKRLAVSSIGDSELAIVDSHIREQLIERQLALAALIRMDKAATREDVDFELGRWKEELKQQGMTLTAYLAKEKLTEAELRRDLLWRISWNRYLAAYLTEANLEKYFKEHAADYDGRKLRVAQILLKVPAKAPDLERQSAFAKAKSIREEITAGKLTFAAAAKAHSQSPSAKEGGEQGWIERHEPMGEEFSKAAFLLAVGETSEPVSSNFGVHLIYCLEIQPGKKIWKDARRELERDVTAFLGRWLAGQQKEKSHIERTDVLPAVELKELSPAKDAQTK